MVDSLSYVTDDVRAPSSPNPSAPSRTIHQFHTDLATIQTS